MKKITFKTLLVAAGLLMGGMGAWADTMNPTVKMTYVDGSDANADTSYGEIAAGETAKAGYNNISAGSVGLVNKGWNCNWITYLQVDASSLPSGATVTGATLTYDQSGSTDGKRTTTVGAGYNSTAWSSTMTFNTADKKITTVGTTQSTSTKSSSTFETKSIDITAAFAGDADNIVTILLYETAAAGCYIKNPAVTVTYTTETAYSVTFAENNSVDATITVGGSNVTAGTSLPNGVYTYTATADGYKDYVSTFTVAGADLVVNFTMTAKSIYSYTVKAVDGSSNDLGTVGSGSGYEDDAVTYYYPEFVLDGTTLYTKNRNGGNPYWGASGTLDADSKEFTVTYGDGTITDVVFYKEAEEMTGFTAKTTNNATIRCSQGTGGIVDGSVKLVTLPAGKYTIFGQVWGTAGLTAGVTANGVDVWTLASTGSLVSSTSSEFNLPAETDLYVYTTGGNDNHMLDLIYIVKTGAADAVYPATVGADKWATYVTPYAMDFSGVAGLKAYTATLSGSTVTLDEAGEVPAGTALVLKATAADTYSVPVIASASAVTNDLKSGAVAAGDNDGATYYGLTVEGDKAKFALVTGAIPAGKAYLVKAGGARELTVVFGEEATGIETVKAQINNNRYYNLQGVEVAQPTKGLYIVNGKKLLVK